MMALLRWCLSALVRLLRERVARWWPGTAERLFPGVFPAPEKRPFGGVFPGMPGRCYLCSYHRYASQYGVRLTLAEHDCVEAPRGESAGGRAPAPFGRRGMP